MMNDHYYLDSSSACMQHTIITTSVLSTLMTIIGVLFGAFKWYHWLPIPTTSITSLIGIISACTLNYYLLILFALIDGIDFLFKVFIIASFVHRKIEIIENCSPYELAVDADNCPRDNWRLDSLNITNGMVYCVFSAIVQLILFTFAIYLVFTVKKYSFYIKNSRNGRGLKRSQDIPDNNA